MTQFKIVFHIALLFIFSCGDLSEKQANRQMIKDGIKDHQLKRVTEDQIITAAYDQGNIIVKQLEQLSKELSYWQTSEGLSVMDSITMATGHDGFRLIFVNELSHTLRNEETALIEAYEYSSDNGQPVHQNVQNIDGQSLLFTSPLSKDDKFLGMWSLYLSRKTLIRNL